MTVCTDLTATNKRQYEPPELQCGFGGFWFGKEIGYADGLDEISHQPLASGTIKMPVRLFKLLDSFLIHSINFSSKVIKGYP